MYVKIYYVNVHYNTMNGITNDWVLESFYDNKQTLVFNSATKYVYVIYSAITEYV